MIRPSDLARGYAAIRAVGAQPTKLLDMLTRHNISFWSAVPEDELSLTLCVRLGDAERVLALSEESRCELELLFRRGAPLKLMQARRRYVLHILPALLFSLLVLASMFTWRIEIVGNEKINDAEILNALEDCGVYIGSFHPSYSSDDIRNRVIAEIPDIKWISVSVFGSRALVQLRERTEIPELYDKREPVNVVAAFPGIIEQLRAFCGKPQFIRGQTVAKGDLLISGAVPSSYGDTIISHARGEVIARTWHEICILMPLEYTAKDYSARVQNRLALKIGESRINFYSSSGITGALCDNIITEHKLGLKGLFSFPVSLICEKTLPYDIVPSQLSEQRARELAEARAREELLRRIGEDGEVVESSVTASVTNGVMLLTLRAECRQDIARERPMTAAEQNEVKIQNEALEEDTNQ